jgi:hypothetical protein
VAELRKNAEQQAEYPPVVFVYRGTAEEGRRFFAKRWSGARAVADEDGSLYDEFGLHRATLRQAVGGAVIKRALEAFRRGIGVGMPGRDPLRMPGLFLVKKPLLVAARRFSHVGDHPDFAKLGEWARAEVEASTSGQSE